VDWRERRGGETEGRPRRANGGTGLNWEREVEEKAEQRYSQRTFPIVEKKACPSQKKKDNTGVSGPLGVITVNTPGGGEKTYPGNRQRRRWWCESRGKKIRKGGATRLSFPCFCPIGPGRTLYVFAQNTKGHDLQSQGGKKKTRLCGRGSGKRKRASRPQGSKRKKKNDSKGGLDVHLTEKVFGLKGGERRDHA